MLIRRDVANLLDRVRDNADGDSPKWAYWRDSGEFNCWRTTDHEYVLQVSHERNRLALVDTAAGPTDGFEVVATPFDGDRIGAAIVYLVLAAPGKGYDRLAKLEKASVHEVEADAPN